MESQTTDGQHTVNSSRTENPSLLQTKTESIVTLISELNAFAAWQIKKMNEFSDEEKAGGWVDI